MLRARRAVSGGVRYVQQGPGCPAYLLIDLMPARQEMQQHVKNTGAPGLTGVTWAAHSEASYRFGINEADN